MIAALFSNPNWDDEKANRQERIKELNRHFNEAIELVYNPDKSKKQEIDWNNPFWQGHKRSMARTREMLGLPPDSTMLEVIESTAEGREELAALEAREPRRWQGIDQFN